MERVVAWRRWRSGSFDAFPMRASDDATGRGAVSRTDRVVDGVCSLQNTSRPLASVLLCYLYTGSGGRALRISSGAGAGNASMTVSWEIQTAFSTGCGRPPRATLWRHGRGTNGSSTVCAATYTVVMATHNMAQARRASDECIVTLRGEMIEHDKTSNIFLNPKQKRTEVYITGRYG